MPCIPRDRSFDSTLALLLDPYEFISKRCRRYGADLLQTRLLLRPTICMTGSEAAELFCDQGRFMRQDATPGRIQKTLLGRGGVQGLDDDAHHHRKRMFMSLMTPERVGHLGQLAADQWRAHARKWTSMDRVVLYNELQEMLTRTVCDWAGVPLAEPEVGRRTRELTMMFDYAGAVGPKHWLSRLARRSAERWIEGVIAQVREGRLKPPEQSPVHSIAWHRDLDHEFLSPRVAAVELLNVLRPTVAVSVFITFAAHALHEHRECLQKLESGPDGYPELFAQEVRRFYPFFPSVMARVRRDFEWQGYGFPGGRKVVLDLYGTNHDPRSWDAPEAFRPERFRRWNGGLFNFIPQGPGDHDLNHRCAGEWITIELMKIAVRVLVHEIAYAVPEQDLRIDTSRLPALPRSRFIISNVRPHV